MSTDEREVLGGPVRGETAKTWQLYNDLKFEPGRVKFFEGEVFAETTSKGEVALACVKCQTVARLEPCGNCGKLFYVLDGRKLRCGACGQGFKSWDCASCACQNPVGSTTLVHKASKGMCFIATAACGTQDCPEVGYLSAWRDQVLERWAVGRAFIRLYYAASPPLARLISESRPMQKVVRGTLLRPTVSLLRRFW